MIDAETGQRGYIITRDTVFLQPYNGAGRKIRRSFNTLRSLAYDNQQQQLDLVVLYRLVIRRFESFADVLKLSNDQQVLTSLRKKEMLNGKYLMDKIRLQIHTMIDQELLSLQQKEKEHQEEISFTPLFTLLLMFFSLLVFIFLYYRINKNVAKLRILNNHLLIAKKEQQHNNAIVEGKNRELERSNIELASFNHMASHDLQEPLRKIQTFISRIQMKEIPGISETDRDYFSKIQSSANRMQKLIDDLLLFSRANKAEKVFELTDLNLVFENAKQELAQTIEEKNAVIQSAHLPTIPVISFQFQQLFINLLSNSLKYCKPSVAPSIQLTCEIVIAGNFPVIKADIEKKYYQLSITDNGSGFEPQYAENLFTLFYRLHHKDEYSGTGIGLSICKKIVENHDGFIEAIGEINKGATFNVYIPVL